MTRRFFPRRAALCGVLCALSGLAASQTQNTTTSFLYDANGNRTQVTDPLGHITKNTYDALNRLSTVTNPSNGITRYSYDALDQITGVTDPRNLVTSYTIDGLGNRIAVTSPDTGTTRNTFDAAGNVLTTTDAKGQTTAYQYDALNRVTQIRYADGSLVTYVYDQGTNAIGRLSQINDMSGSTQYGYEPHGRVVTETRTINNVVYVTAYRYDNAGRLMGLTYPSGRSIEYIRDSLGQITQINTTKDGVTQALVTQVAYRPFGPAQTVVFGNNQSYTRGYDTDGRVTSYTLNNQAQAISYDAASRITAVVDANANKVSYGYDVLDRLISALRAGGSLGYTYDAVGNRSSQTNGAAVTSYSYGAASNRLTQVTGSPTSVIATDANGSITNNGRGQFGYDARGRMTSAATAIGNVQYQHNALGQRVLKITPTDTTVFHYDQGGKLIAESTSSGANPGIGQEYVYLDDLPVAVLK